VGAFSERVWFLGIPPLKRVPPLIEWHMILSIRVSDGE
jgi:hypothetical protein